MGGQAEVSVVLTMKQIYQIQSYNTADLQYVEIRVCGMELTTPLTGEYSFKGWTFRINAIPYSRTQMQNLVRNIML